MSDFTFEESRISYCTKSSVIPARPFGEGEGCSWQDNILYIQKYTPKNLSGKSPKPPFLQNLDPPGGPSCYVFAIVN